LVDSDDANDVSKEGVYIPQKRGRLVCVLFPSFFSF
jgi:hypothetical protein